MRDAPQYKIPFNDNNCDEGNLDLTLIICLVDFDYYCRCRVTYN